MGKTKLRYSPELALLLMILGSTSAYAGLTAPVYPGAVPANEDLESRTLYFEEAFLHTSV